jgi:pyruvate kinase
MIEQNARRTKIVKSFQGRTLSGESVKQLTNKDIGPEVDVVRLVYSKDQSTAICEFIKNLGNHRNDKTRFPVMLDVSTSTQAQIHGLNEPLELAFGEKMTISPAGGSGRLQIKTDFWDSLFNEGSTVYAGYGYVTMKTKTVSKSLVQLEVIQGGSIFPDMPIFVPETRSGIKVRDVSQADLKDILKCGIDYLVIPGQWSQAQINELRAGLDKDYGDTSPWLLAKIDAVDCYERLEEIVSVVDGVMISRREIALTANPATVPMIAKEIIQVCSDNAKVVVTASEMLGSMRVNATPTRAEVSDVANAVIDGTDAVVLSEEVANGRYGMEAVSAMHRIICDVEASSSVKPNWIKVAPVVENEMDAIAYNAYRTAERIRAKAIVCITKAGNTALKLASFRSEFPVIGVTFSPHVMRRLCIVRGVEGLLLNMDPNIDQVLPIVNDNLVRGSWLKANDSIIFVTLTISPVGRESSNLFTIQNLT